MSDELWVSRFLAFLVTNAILITNDGRHNEMPAVVTNIAAVTDAPVVTDAAVVTNAAVATNACSHNRGRAAL
jgi:hypothetical protein